MNKPVTKPSVVDGLYLRSCTKQREMSILGYSSIGRAGAFEALGCRFNSCYPSGFQANLVKAPS